MAEFFNMGGYAFFIWMSYGITALVLIANIVIPIVQEKRVKRDLEMRMIRNNKSEE